MRCAKSQIMILENRFDCRLPLLCAKENSFNALIPSPRNITSPYDTRFLCSKKILILPYSRQYNERLGWVPPRSYGLVAVAMLCLKIHK
jgi:hypothetical protein